MRVGILGSGFGLYGYMPALVRLGTTPVLPVRYREKLRGRRDVASFEDRVLWVADERALLDCAEALVLAVRPTDQVALARAALSAQGIGRLLLEKPIAPDPAAARALLGALGASGRTVRAGFNFRYTPWAGRCRDWLTRPTAPARLRIDWRFRAHHYRTGLETWKRRPAEGGGALRFFGIHLVALLAEFGYRGAHDSVVRGEGPQDARSWEATLAGPGLPGCAVAVETDADEEAFLIEGIMTGPGSAPLRIALDDPFAETQADGPLDRRVEVLGPLCRDFLAGPPGIPGWYAASIELWESVEAQAARGEIDGA